jgi:hypothetical protein
MEVIVQKKEEKHVRERWVIGPKGGRRQASAKRDLEELADKLRDGVVVLDLYSDGSWAVHAVFKKEICRSKWSFKSVDLTLAQSRIIKGIL